MSVKENIKLIQKHVGAIQDGIIGNETLSKFRQKYGISKAMTAHFFGNIDHESGGFRIVRENMNYSASRLLQVFPKYFAKETASQYANKPELIGNKVYGGRMGNAPDEGYKFRGKGFLQTTGKNNYTRLGNYLGVDLISAPDRVASDYPLESAIFFFTDNKLWSLVNDVSELSIQKVRRRVNGGLNGINDVRNKVHKYYNLMT